MSLEEGISLKIGGDLGPLRDALATSDKMVDKWANSATEKNRKVAQAAAAAAEEKAKRVEAAAAEETKRIKAELEMQAMLAERAAKRQADALAKAEAERVANAAKAAAAAEAGARALAERLAKIEADKAKVYEGLGEKTTQAELNRAAKREAALTAAAAKAAEHAEAQKAKALAKAEAAEQAHQAKVEAIKQAAAAKETARAEAVKRLESQMLDATKAAEHGRTLVVKAEAERRLVIEKNAAERLKEAQAKAAAEAKAKAASQQGAAVDAVSAGGAALAGGAVAVGLTAGVGAAVKSFADFQAVLNQVRAVSGATTAQMAAMSAQAIDLGAKTKFSGLEAAQGMAELAKAGFTASQTMAAIPGVLALAASGGVDVAQAAELAGATLNGFRLQASDAGKVADILAKAANLSAIGITDMQYSMKYIAPVAASASQSLEEMATAMVIMGNQGIKGEQAGTTLRSALIRLQKPPKEAAEALTALGVSIQDTQGKMLPLSTILDQVRVKTEKMTEVKRNETTAEIFGTEALSGMLALLSQTPKAYQDARAAVEDYNGAAEEMASIMNSGVGATFEQLQGSAESLAIIFGKQFAPALDAVMKGLISFADLIQGLPKEVFAAAAGLTAAAVAMAGLVTAGVALGAAVAILGPAIAGLSVVLGGAGLSFGAVGAAIGGVSLAVYALVTGYALLGDETATLTGEQVKAKAAISKMAEEYETLSKKTGRTNEENERLRVLYEKLNELAPELLTGTRNLTGAVELDRAALLRRNEVIADEIRLREKASAAQALQLRQDAASARIRMQDLAARERMLAGQLAAATYVGTDDFEQRKLSEALAATRAALAQARSDVTSSQAAYDTTSQSVGGGSWEETRTPGPAVGSIGGETDRQRADREKREAREKAKAARLSTAQAKAAQRRAAAATRAARGQSVNASDLALGRHEEPRNGQRQGARRPYGGHAGEDYNAVRGTPVAALSAGIVESIAPLGDGDGVKLAIRRANGVIEEYLHLSQTAVRVGQQIEAGQNIGRTGGKQQHLHFQARIGRNFLNVADYAKQVMMQRFGTTDRAAIHRMAQASGKTAAELDKEMAELEAAERAKAWRNRPQAAGQGDLGRRVGIDGKASLGRMGLANPITGKLDTVRGELKDRIDESPELKRFLGEIAEVTEGSNEAKAAINGLTSSVISMATNPSLENIANQLQNLVNSEEKLGNLAALGGKLSTTFAKAGGGAEGLGAGLGVLLGGINPVTVGIQGMALVLPAIVDGFDTWLNGPAGLRAINTELTKLEKGMANFSNSRAALGVAQEAGGLEQEKKDIADLQDLISGLVNEYDMLGGVTGEAADMATLSNWRTFGSQQWIDASSRQGSRDKIKESLDKAKALKAVREADLAINESIAETEAARAAASQDALENADRRINESIRESAIAKETTETVEKRAYTEEEIANIARGLVGLSGEALDNAAKQLEIETGISAEKLKQTAHGEKLRQLAELTQQLSDTTSQLTDIQTERLEIEREITALVTKQADEAARIRGESIAVRQETEAQYKARRLAELEAEKADGLARLRPRYETVRATEIGLLQQQANAQMSLQGLKGDAGTGVFRDIQERLAAALQALATMPKFHGGGSVKAPQSKEVLAILRGGETVITPEQVRAAQRGAMTGNPYVGPGTAAAAQRAGMTVQVNVSAGIIGDEEKLTRTLLRGLNTAARRFGV